MSDYLRAHDYTTDRTRLYVAVDSDRIHVAVTNQLEADGCGSYQAQAIADGVMQSLKWEAEEAEPEVVQ